MSFILLICYKNGRKLRFIVIILFRKSVTTCVCIFILNYRPKVIFFILENAFRANLYNKPCATCGKLCLTKCFKSHLILFKNY